MRRFFKTGEEPLDQHFGLDLPENVNTYRIVGIVRDARFAGFQMNRPPRPMFYVPLAQTVNYANPMMRRLEYQSHFVRGLLLVTNTPVGTLEPLVKRTLASVDPNLTVTSIRTLQQQLDRTFDQQRAVASLAGLFGLVALVLAAIGLYGVTAYTVAQRTNEIGIRMALGAGRGTVVGMVLNGAFRRVLIGLVLGLPLAVGAGYLLSAQLYGVQFWDPAALAVGALSLGTCALVAALIPARRAASISPIRALRETLTVVGSGLDRTLPTRVRTSCTDKVPMLYRFRLISRPRRAYGLTRSTDGQPWRDSAHAAPSSGVLRRPVDVEDERLPCAPRVSRHCGLFAARVSGPNSDRIDFRNRRRPARRRSSPARLPPSSTRPTTTRGSAVTDARGNFQVTDLQPGTLHGPRRAGQLPHATSGRASC